MSCVRTCLSSVLPVWEVDFVGVDLVDMICPTMSNKMLTTVVSVLLAGQLMTAGIVC